MKSFLSVFFVLIFFSFSNLLIAQSGLDTGQVAQQFDYLIKESNDYKEFKVIKRNWIYKLKSNVGDSIDVLKKNLLTTAETVNNQNKQIGDLNAQLQNTNLNLEQVNAEKDSISFLGMQLSKSTYKSIMWGIAGLLGALLLFFIYSFYRSNHITNETRRILARTQGDFDSFKKKALEREQIIKRQLQDEINKHL